MKLPLIAACLVAGSTWTIAFAGDTATVNPKTAKSPFTTARTNPNPVAPPANDDCSAATVVVGNGPFPFTNIGATTGPQQGLGCGSGNAYSDVWFSWQANFSGQCQFTLCNGGVAYDSLIAAYPGSVCPTPGSALGCNDDSCGLVSKVQFTAVNGNNYMLQIGGWCTTCQGSGSFELQPPPPPPPPCINYDDGITDNLLGWIAGGDMVWLSRFGNVGVPTTISSIDVMWGSLLFPGYSGGNGQATHVFLWSDDASQDGLPGTVGALLINIPTTTSAIDTDTYVNYPIAPTTITGIFYAGTNLPHNPGQYVASMDQTVHTYTDVSWFFGINQVGQFANYANPGANVQPPVSFDAVIPSQVCIRVHCITGPATYSCDPGTTPTQACPCSNPPSGAGRGCNNSSNTGGASITGAGNASVAASTVVFTTANEKPTALTILLQGTTLNTGGIVFGQGIRCVAGVLKRLYTHSAVGGSITAPSGTDQDIPTRSNALGDPISAGQSRHYLAYYRDATVLGGCSALSTFNDTNTASVLWGP